MLSLAQPSSKEYDSDYSDDDDDDDNEMDELSVDQMIFYYSLAHAPVNVTDFSIGSINCVRHFPQT
jgi:hypothetical protein